MSKFFYSRRLCNIYKQSTMTACFLLRQKPQTLNHKRVLIRKGKIKKSITSTNKNLANSRWSHAWRHRLRIVKIITTVKKEAKAVAALKHTIMNRVKLLHLKKLKHPKSKKKSLLKDSEEGEMVEKTKVLNNWVVQMLSTVIKILIK